MSIGLVSLLNSDEAPLQKPSSLRSPLSKFVRSMAGTGGRGNRELSEEISLVYPFQFRYVGRASGVHTLFASSLEAQEEWKTNIEKALSAHNAIQESNQVWGPITSEITLILYLGLQACAYRSG